VNPALTTAAILAVLLAGAHSYLGERYIADMVARRHCTCATKGVDMTGAKLFVCYPHPKDAAAFERAYAEEHLPLAGPILARAGAEKAVFTRLSDSPQGKPHFYRIAEIHFPSVDTLRAALASPDVQKAVADANRISTGGPVVAMFSGEDQTVTF
jgi:uncharacterized protein (TIGR02118 family)